MLSNTVSGFIFTSLYKISNHLKPSQSQTPFSFTRILFCDYFDLFLQNMQIYQNIYQNTNKQNS